MKDEIIVKYCNDWLKCRRQERQVKTPIYFKIKKESKYKTKEDCRNKLKSVSNPNKWKHFEFTYWKEVILILNLKYPAISSLQKSANI